MYITKFSKWFYEFKARHPRIVMSLLVFGIIPLVSSFILGYEMKSDVPTNIPLVVVNHDNSEFSRTFTGFIKDSEYFNIVKYSQSDSDIEEMLKTNEAYAGLIIPANFYSEYARGQSAKFNYYIRRSIFDCSNHIQNIAFGNPVDRKSRVHDERI